MQHRKKYITFFWLFLLAIISFPILFYFKLWPMSTLGGISFLIIVNGIIFFAVYLEKLDKKEKEIAIEAANNKQIALEKEKSRLAQLRVQEEKQKKESEIVADKKKLARLLDEL